MNCKIPTLPVGDSKLIDSQAKSHICNYRNYSHCSTFPMGQQGNEENERDQTNAAVTLFLPWIKNLFIILCLA